MKQLIKKPTILTFFCFLWIFPLINRNTETHLWIFIICCALSVLSLMFIKNKVFSFIAALISAFVPAVFQFDSLFLILPPVTVIFCFVFLQKKAAVLKKTSAVKNNNKKKQSSFSQASTEKNKTAVYTGAVLSIIISTGIWIYLFIKKFPENNTDLTKKYELSHMIIFGLLFAFGALAVISIQKKAAAKQAAYDKGFTAAALSGLKSLYISGFFCFIQSIFNFYISNNNFTNGYERAFFFPWFVYFFLIIYYEDPVFLTLIEKGKEAFGYFSTKHSE